MAWRYAHRRWNSAAAVAAVVAFHGWPVVDQTLRTRVQTCAACRVGSVLVFCALYFKVRASMLRALRELIGRLMAKWRPAGAPRSLGARPARGWLEPTPTAACGPACMRACLCVQAVKRISPGATPGRHGEHR